MNCSKINILSKMYYSVSKKFPQICIVGAGPAGFYAAMHLIKHLPCVNVDILEKLPVPFGLIRYGVAPDHPEVKNVINQFTKVALQDNVNFYGNISLGKDISLLQLRQSYDAVLLTYGAQEDKLLSIENEDASNIISARNFVGWYNGLPNDKDLKIDLSGHTSVILGQGNVALDVARILLTPVDLLRKTDITQHAISVLAESKVKELYLVGRRGPLQAAFTIKELREQLKLNKCQTVWREEDFMGIKEVVESLPRPRKRLTELMLKSLNEHRLSSSNNNVKYFKPIFFRSPNKFLVNNKKQLTGIELNYNKLIGDKIEEQRCIPLEDKEIINCNLAFRSIGYRSVNVEDTLVLSPNGYIPNDKGRVIEDMPTGLSHLYVAGWLGTGPVGVILHTMGNAFQVAKSIIEDFKIHENIVSRSGYEEIRNTLIKKNIQIVDWKGWEKIDEYEKIEGKKLEKPREKICSIKKMLEIAAN